MLHPLATVLHPGLVALSMWAMSTGSCQTAIRFDSRGILAMARNQVRTLHSQNPGSPLHQDGHRCSILVYKIQFDLVQHPHPSLLKLL